MCIRDRSVDERRWWRPNSSDWYGGVKPCRVLNTYIRPNCIKPQHWAVQLSALKVDMSSRYILSARWLSSCKKLGLVQHGNNGHRLQTTSHWLIPTYLMMQVQNVYYGHTGFKLLKSDRNCMWPADIRCRIRLKPQPDSVMAVLWFCMLIMCMKLRNLRINCSVLMSVIWFVLLLLHIVMRNICLFECQLLLTNDLELTRFYNIRALMPLYWQAHCGLYVT